MSRFRACAWLAGPVTVLAFLSTPADGGPSDKSDAAAECYVPREADFRPVYLRDEANQRVQTWDQYWGWVKSFYEGSFRWAGWVRETQDTLALVTDSAARTKLLALHNQLGRRVAEEWAKDNGLRKVSTADLVRWHTAIREARRAERGSGTRLKAVLEAIDAEVTKKLPRRGPPGTQDRRKN